MSALQVHGSDATMTAALLPIIHELSTLQGSGASVAAEAAMLGGAAPFPAPATSNRSKFASTYCTGCKLR